MALPSARRRANSPTVIRAADGAGNNAVGFGQFGAAMPTQIDKATEVACFVACEEDRLGTNLADKHPPCDCLVGNSDTHPGRLKHTLLLNEVELVARVGCCVAARCCARGAAFSCGSQRVGGGHQAQGSSRLTAPNGSRTSHSILNAEWARLATGVRSTLVHRARKRQQPPDLCRRVIVRFGLVTVSRSTRPLPFRRRLHEAQALRLSPSCERDQPCGNRSRPE